MKDSNRFYLSLILLGFSMFLFGYLLSEFDIIENALGAQFGDPPEEIYECNGNSLIEDVYCVNDYVKSIFQYVEREDIPKSFEDLKENGGDCYDWSRLYAEVFNAKGYNVREEVLLAGKNGHVFVIVWDDELSEYCLVDQEEVECFGIT